MHTGQRVSQKRNFQEDPGHFREHQDSSKKRLWKLIREAASQRVKPMPATKLMGGQGMAAAAVLLNMVATNVISPELGLALAGVHIARQHMPLIRTRARDTDKLRRMDWPTFRAEQLKEDKDFHRYLRVSPKLFDQMLEGITPDEATVARQRRAAANAAGTRARKDPGGARGGFVEYPLKLAITLRFMAGASYLDLMYLFGVKKATLYTTIWKTLASLDKCPALPDMTLEHDVNDLQRCRALSQGFANRTGARHVNGCIGALDGMALKIEEPKTAVNFHKYFCRKLFHAVSVQAVCDSNRKFIFMDMSQSGSTHDSTAWSVARTLDGNDRIGLLMANSRVLRDGCATLGPYGFFLVADDAYRCCPTVMAPWSSAPRLPAPNKRAPRTCPTLTPARHAPAGAATGSYEDSFNHQLSRARINIECAFGMLTQKFLIFGRPLPWLFFKSPSSGTEDFKKPILLLRVAMKIHNACVDVQMEEAPPHPSDFYGGYDTPNARAQGAHRGQAQQDPRSTSGRTHLDGSAAEEATWDDGEASAAFPPEYAASNQPKAAREKKMKVSEARVRLTDAIASKGLHRPDPEQVAKVMRAAKRQPLA